MTRAQDARRFVDDWVDDCERMTTFQCGTVYMPLFRDGKWVDVPLHEILDAFAAARCAQVEEWKESAMQVLAEWDKVAEFAETAFVWATARRRKLCA
jgi:hypothetical protein